MDDIERRFDALERVVFEIDALEARIARLEQHPPTPLGGRELQRQRVEAVLRARRDGHSHRQIAGATGVSQAGVRRICSVRATRRHVCRAGSDAISFKRT